MTRFLTVLLALSLPLSVAAQPIHGNPQKTAYADPAEWPTISNQCHWEAPGIGLVPEMPAHTHVDMTFPVSAEVGTALIAVPFKLTLFHTNGKIISLSGSMLKSWTLDNGKVFPLQGDVNGVVVYTGTATFDPSLGVASGRTPKHGFYPLFLNTDTRYTNGDRLLNSLRLSVFSVIDPTQKEVAAGDGTGIRTQSTCNVFDAASSPFVDRWQSNILQFVQTLPLFGPVSSDKPWRLQARGWNYSPASSLLPPGVLEVFVDPDLHNLVTGTKIDSMTGASSVARSLYLPTGIPDGTHKLMVAWRRPNFAGDKELTSILTFNVTNGAGGPAQPPNNTSLFPESGVVQPPPHRHRRMTNVRRGSTATGPLVWGVTQPIALVNLNAPVPPPVVTPPPVKPPPVVPPKPPPVKPPEVSMPCPSMSFDASLALVDEIAKLWQQWHPAHPGCAQAHLQCDWGQLHLWFWRSTIEGWSRDKCLRAFYAQEGKPYPNP